MTREDFEGKWLTLGTESRLDEDRSKPPSFLPKGTPARLIMGEKGIGRLAVSTIGPQTLVLTRAIRGKKVHKLVVGFVHWGLFEIPGINLDEIDIPLIELMRGKLPGKKEVEELKEGVRTNIKVLGRKIKPDLRRRILGELKAFTIYPAEIKLAEGPSLKGKSQGTHFYVMPCDPILEDDIDAKGSEGVAPPLIKILLGFTDTLGKKRKSSALQTVFRDHLEDGDCIDLIGPNEFFTSKDFKKVDQRFEGRFDEKGRFEGTVTIFGGDPQDYELEWPSGMGLLTDCGPFTIRFATIQGDQKESLIADDKWVELDEKLRLLGGLYVYKDGIRILPYGSPDYDFLSIELRRSKSAADWYFSHRRMFGAIRLSQANNPELREKAGREGFISNKAYRQMRDMLENLLRQLAIDFFRKEAPKGDEFRQRRDEIKARNKTLEEREARLEKAKAAHEKALEAFFNDLENDQPASEVSTLKAAAEKRAKIIIEKGRTKSLGNDLYLLEKNHRGGIESLRRKYTVKRAQGFAVSKESAAGWRAYQEEFGELEKKLFGPSDIWVAKLAAKTAKAANAVINLEETTMEAVKQTSAASRRAVSSVDKETRAQAAKLNQAIQSEAKKRTENVVRAVEMAMKELSGLDFKKLSSNRVLKIRQELEGRIRGAANENVEALEGLLAQVGSMLQTLESGQSLSDETAALESALIETRAERDLYTDLAQVGTALSVVHHEFASTIKQVRKHIRRLGAWRNADEELGNIYDGVRESFEHLDGYLGLFAPLNRRIQRRAIDINGEELRRYILSVFGDRLSRHGIALLATETFDTSEIKAYPSTIYPTFLNLVDNAIYWITSRKSGKREIHFDADKKGFVIWNTGPGIPIDRKDWIFEFANTRKPGGRGMGLYISRQSLQSEDFGLVLESPGKNKPPRFRIVFPPSTNDST